MDVAVFRGFICVIIFVQVSGGSSGELQPLIARGKDTRVADVPWHVGVYEKINGTYFLQCGGTLISKSIVITAAHCFWNEKLARCNDPSSYKVAVGKSYSDWRIKESGSRRKPIAEIFVHSGFRGNLRHYQYDIAVVQLRSPVNTLTTTIQFASVDWERSFESTQQVSGSKGIVAGWGYTENERVSSRLRSVELPYVESQQCHDLLSLEFQAKFTQDKFCAGYTDLNTSVCPGDSGGGLVFRVGRSDTYFLRGVVSIAFRPAGFNGKCYSQQVSGFTQLSYGDIQDWIKQFVDLPDLGLECGMRNYRPLPPTRAADGHKTVAVGQIPWNAGVYIGHDGQFHLSCGGTLIRANIIITTAQCVYDEKENKVQDASKLKVALGKMLRYWNTDLPGNAVQRRGVERIDVAPQYRGRQDYFSNDVALLTLTKDVDVTNNVNVACLDFEDDSFHLINGVKGTVAGWAFIHDSQGPSDTLLSVDLPWVDSDTCFFKTPSRYHNNYITSDKFCVGFYNLNLRTCAGDGGAGFMVVKPRTGQYFLRGVLSVGLDLDTNVTSQCNPNGYSAVTSFKNTSSWIRSIVQ